MANETPQNLSGEGLRAAASETVRAGTDIRAKVHELTLLALNSQREAHESRIRRAIREALLDQDSGFPPPHRWADED